MKSVIRSLRVLCNRNGLPCVYLTLGLAIGIDLHGFTDFVFTFLKELQYFIR